MDRGGGREEVISMAYDEAVLMLMRVTASECVHSIFVFISVLVFVSACSHVSCSHVSCVMSHMSCVMCDM